MLKPLFDRVRIAVNSVCGVGNSLIEGAYDLVNDLSTVARDFVVGVFETVCKTVLRIVDVAEEVAEGAMSTLTGSTDK